MEDTEVLFMDMCYTFNRYDIYCVHFAVWVAIFEFRFKTKFKNLRVVRTGPSVTEKWSKGKPLNVTLGHRYWLSIRFRKGFLKLWLLRYIQEKNHSEKISTSIFPRPLRSKLTRKRSSGIAWHDNCFICIILYTWLDHNHREHKSQNSKH